MLIFLALLLVGGQFAYIRLGGGVQFAVIEGVILLHGLYLLLAQKCKITRSRLVTLACVWIGWAGVTWLVGSFTSHPRSSLIALAYLGRVIVLFVYGLCVSDMPRARVIRLILCLIPLTSLLQYLFLPDLRFMLQYGWDPHMYRAVGVFFDPPIAGGVYGLLWLSLVMYPEKSKKMQVALLMLIFITIIYLFSRSTYLALIVTTGIYLARTKRFISLVGFVGVTVAVILFAPYTVPGYSQLESAKIGRTSTATSRMTEIRAGIQAWSSSPVWGIGYGRVGEYKEKLQVPNSKFLKDTHSSSAFHSFWITQLAMTGIVGVGLLSYVLVSFVRQHPHLLYPLMWVSLIGIFDNIVLHPLIVTCFILLFGASSRHRSDRHTVSLHTVQTHTTRKTV